MTDRFSSDEIASVSNTVGSQSDEEFVREGIHSYIAKQHTYTYRVLLEELMELDIAEEQEHENANKGAGVTSSAHITIGKLFQQKREELLNVFKQTKQALLKHRDYLLEQNREYFFHTDAYGTDRGDLWAV